MGLVLLDLYYSVWCFVDHCLSICPFLFGHCFVSFDLRILINPLVSSNSSCSFYEYGYNKYILFSSAIINEYEKYHQLILWKSEIKWKFSWKYSYWRELQFSFCRIATNHIPSKHSKDRNIFLLNPQKSFDILDFAFSIRVVIWCFH